MSIEGGVQKLCSGYVPTWKRFLMLFLNFFGEKAGLLNIFDTLSELQKNCGKSHVHTHFCCHIDAIIKWFAYKLIRLSLYWFSYWFLQCDYDVNVICSILKDNDVEWLSKISIIWIDLLIIVGLTCPRYSIIFGGEIEGIFGVFNFFHTWKTQCRISYNEIAIVF